MNIIIKVYGLVPNNKGLFKKKEFLIKFSYKLNLQSSW